MASLRERQARWRGIIADLANTLARDLLPETDWPDAEELERLAWDCEALYLSIEAARVRRWLPHAVTTGPDLVQ